MTKKEKLIKIMASFDADKHIGEHERFRALLGFTSELVKGTKNSLVYEELLTEMAKRYDGSIIFEQYVKELKKVRERV